MQQALALVMHEAEVGLRFMRIDLCRFLAQPMVSVRSMNTSSLRFNSPLAVTSCPQLD